MFVSQIRRPCGSPTRQRESRNPSLARRAGRGSHWRGGLGHGHLGTESGEAPAAVQAGASLPLPSASVGWLLLEKLPLFALAAVASWLTMVAVGPTESLMTWEDRPLPAR